MENYDVAAPTGPFLALTFAPGAPLKPNPGPFAHASNHPVAPRETLPTVLPGPSDITPRLGALPDKSHRDIKVWGQ